MEAVLIFIDGTICDMRHRIPAMGTEKFFLGGKPGQRQTYARQCGVSE